ncbi:MAG: F0F1 ATP synthase subunit delta [bacterium]|nr:F0F1 ATP synthase subunit delta [bacterium]
MSKAVATPAQYAAAFWAALGDATPAQESLVPEAFARLLADDQMIGRWAEIEQALAALAVVRTGAVARAQDSAKVADALGPGAAVAVQSELIAGARLQAGGRLVDSSISGQLQRLRDALAGDR